MYINADINYLKKINEEMLNVCKMLNKSTEEMEFVAKELNRQSEFGHHSAKLRTIALAINDRKRKLSVLIQALNNIIILYRWNENSIENNFEITSSERCISIVKKINLSGIKDSVDKIISKG